MQYESSYLHKGIAFEHHGIKGQKWGVQNGPPYPLSEGKGKSTGRQKGSITVKKKKVNGMSRKEFHKRLRNPSPKDVEDPELRDLMEMEYQEFKKMSKDQQDGFLFKSKFGYISKKGPEYWESDNKQSIEDYGELQREVIKKSGDWYNSKPVSPGFKKYIQDKKELWKEHEDLFKQRNVSNKSAIDKKLKTIDTKMDILEDDLMGTVLKDLGLPDNPKNRKFIRPVVIWD